jgi:hypothetical protein
LLVLRTRIADGTLWALGPLRSGRTRGARRDISGPSASLEGFVSNFSTQQRILCLKNGGVVHHGRAVLWRGGREGR